MSDQFNENNYSLKMDKSLISFNKDTMTLRTGRANAAMLDKIKVDVYGQQMPINQLATITVPESRLIAIQVWDKSNCSLISSFKLPCEITPVSKVSTRMEIGFATPIA